MVNQQNGSNKVVLNVFTGIFIFIFGIITFVGAVFTVVGVVTNIKLDDLSENGIETTGYVLYTNSENTETCVSFYDDYDEYEYTARAYSSNIHSGDMVTVYYEDGNPENAKVKELDGIIGSIFSTIGIVMLAVGIILITITIVIRVLIGKSIDRKNNNYNQGYYPYQGGY